MDSEDDRPHALQPSDRNQFPHSLDNELQDEIDIDECRSQRINEILAQYIAVKNEDGKNSTAVKSIGEEKDVEESKISEQARDSLEPVSYTHLTLPTTPYV
eukprot:TRINITY_DN7785_c0_g2_i20.p1 TRINITY_DN7785_c0_g2~~TRINITY_DN7785_c0_g2_i20.p1  ORF type:complete len:101 (-),score=29.66 TRINITY_DN7785_c0_g2_i20:47-349(-)